MSETYISRVGIVDEVKANRSKSEVKSLRVTVRFETTLPNESTWATEPQIDNVMFTIPPGEGVNPGDVVTLSLAFKNPFGQRFVPALTVGGEDVTNPHDEGPEVIDEDGPDAPTYTEEAPETDEEDSDDDNDES